MSDPEVIAHAALLRRHVLRLLRQFKKSTGARVSALHAAPLLICKRARAGRPARVHVADNVHLTFRLPGGNYSHL